MAQLGTIPQANIPVVYNNQRGGIGEQLMSALISSLVPKLVDAGGRGFKAATDNMQAGQQVGGGMAPSILQGIMGAPSTQQLQAKARDDQLFEQQLAQSKSGTDLNLARISEIQQPNPINEILSRLSPTQQQTVNEINATNLAAPLPFEIGGDFPTPQPGGSYSDMVKSMQSGLRATGEENFEERSKMNERLRSVYGELASTRDDLARLKGEKDPELERIDRAMVALNLEDKQLSVEAKRNPPVKPTEEPSLTMEQALKRLETDRNWDFFTDPDTGQRYLVNERRGITSLIK